MRIIAGSRKGLRIKLPEDSTARPVTDRIKESVFGILSGKLPGAMVLDLFAGAGSFGLEALSRGAGGAVFVDSSRECASAIRANLELLNLEGEVFCAPASEALKKLYDSGRKFDIIFIDPPFKSGKEDIENALESLCSRDLPAEGAVIAARCHFKTVLPESSSGIECFREKRYGENIVLFYIYRGGK